MAERSVNDGPTPAVAEAVHSAVGKDAVEWESVIGGGYTRQAKWRVRFADGSTAFVKAAREEPYASALRREVSVYETVDGPFLPRLVGARDDGALVVLAVEDLVEAQWPPPYPDDVGPLFEALDALAGTPVPAGLRAWTVARSNWQQIADDAEPFLALGLCSAAWLEHVLERFVQAESRVSWAGDDFVHYDVYSGNVCFVGTRALLVDWDTAGRGNRWIDVAFALPNVRAEGARLPDVGLPQEGDYAALLSGHFAVEAPAPLPSWAEG
ncbi:MAG: aminoglycoside phosphotransferase family protein, partial [Actinomycetota bacterium]|nr:aminoglycoside phosphotransferase family protein [Actinomycetota bacterium]